MVNARQKEGIIMKSKIPAWLASAVFYEIYPQSFYDANGDGIGDIAGIIGKLDHVKSLGANAIWLNPCFTSPFQDAGYDISDFYSVDPRYGTNEDLRRLFSSAKEKGIRVILDLVAGHTSVEHPWFKESARATKNKYSNWYIWTDSVWHGGSGHATVNGYGERDGNYLTNFFWFQPALNYGFAKPDPKCPWQLPVTHPDVKAVRAELKNIMRFWLDMGASGFRVDMAASLVKGDQDKKAVSSFWHEVRAMFDRNYPDAVLVSEWGSPEQAIPAGFHMDFTIHCGSLGKAYTSLLRNDPGSNVFPVNGVSFFNRSGKGDITAFLKDYLAVHAKIKSKGHISIPTGNHDLPRISFNRNHRDCELIFAFLLTMPGVPFIYYGDEIGLAQQSDLTSKEGGYNRTGARTPMQWNNGKNAGFSRADEKSIYLPVDNKKGRPSVEEQEHDRSSLLNKIRVLSELRHTNPALASDGELTIVYAKQKTYPLIYLRADEHGRFLIAINPSQKPVSLKLRTAKIKQIRECVIDRGAIISMKKGTCSFSMRGVSYGVYKIE
ncbi:MAG: glycosylase [Spirochaetes bacterium]|nr:glycosylase [Spirochaetota bacterium]